MSQIFIHCAEASFKEMENQKTLFLLLGPSQSGKTQTVKLLSRLIPKDDSTLVFRAKKWIECLEVVDYKGVRIGINSRSDKFPVFKENFEFLVNEMQCSVVVSAANEKTKGVESFLEQIQTDGWQLKVVQKFPDFCNRSNKEAQLSLNLDAAKALWVLVIEDLKKENIRITSL